MAEKNNNKMSKIAIWVLVGIIVVGGGYFSLNAAKNNNSKVIVTEENTSLKSEVTTKTDKKAEPLGKKMAFSQFIKQGKGAYECTVNQYVQNIESKGKVYINDTMIRGEFNTKVAGMSIDTNMIVRDGYTYNWSSLLPGTGFKAKAVASTEGNLSTGTSGEYSFNAEQIGDYDCQIWTLDESKFVIPAGIIFKEV